MVEQKTKVNGIEFFKGRIYGIDQQLRLVVIYCNNQSCVKLSENPVCLDRSKHIDFRYHSIWDYVQRRAVQLWYISTDE